MLDPKKAIIVTFTVDDGTLDGRQRCQAFETLAECSAWFAEQRDAGCYGASDLGADKVIMPDGCVLRISYNGKIWSEGDILVYDPFTGYTIPEYAS